LEQDSLSRAVNPAKTASAGDWWVEVHGKSYGPYTLAQLSRFVTEGRVRPNTRICNGADGAWIEARGVIGLTGPAPKHAANDSAPQAANVFVCAEIRSGAQYEFLAALESMGSICELGGGLWLVRTKYSAGILRNALSQTLVAGDRFVVIDATRDRVAWFNLGPEVDARVSQVWNAPLREDVR
jgi:GYF domain 2